MELKPKLIHYGLAESIGLARGPTHGGMRVDVEYIDEIECPSCGTTVPLKNDPPQNYFFRPWNLAHGRKAVKAYVESLGDEAQEWLMALYVDGDLQLLAVDTVAQGDIGSCPVPFRKLIYRACAVRAEGFVLVHNHPSGDPAPSVSDIQVTRRLARVSHELNVPLLDHLIVAGDRILEIGEWYWEERPYARQTIPLGV